MLDELASRNEDWSSCCWSTGKVAAIWGNNDYATVISDLITMAWMHLIFLLRSLVQCFEYLLLILGSMHHLSHFLEWVKLVYKFHYMIHYASQIETFGPLIHSWTMRQDAKLSFFKRASQNSNQKMFAKLLLKNTNCGSVMLFSTITVVLTSIVKKNYTWVKLNSFILYTLNLCCYFDTMFFVVY